MLDLGRLNLGPRRFLKEMREELAAVPYERITVRPLGATIGAEIGGVDLRETLDDATFEEVRRAHHDYKVIFFRDQDITAEQQIGFAHRFGELEEHPSADNALQAAAHVRETVRRRRSASPSADGRCRSTLQAPPGVSAAIVPPARARCSAPPSRSPGWKRTMASPATTSSPTCP